MEILHANIILLTFSIYPDLWSHILIVMIFRHSACGVCFVNIFKMTP